MIGVMIALMAILAAFPFVSGHPAGAIIVTFLFGAGAFGTVPLLQTKVVAASETRNNDRHLRQHRCIYLG